MATGTAKPPKFKTKATSWLQVTMDECIDYLVEHGTQEQKQEFRDWLYSTKDGKKSKKINWGNARRKFLEKYAPTLLPKKKEPKPKKSDRIAELL